MFDRKNESCHLIARINFTYTRLICGFGSSRPNNDFTSISVHYHLFVAIFSSRRRESRSRVHARSSHAINQLRRLFENKSASRWCDSQAPSHGACAVVYRALHGGENLFHGGMPEWNVEPQVHGLVSSCNRTVNRKTSGMWTWKSNCLRWKTP